MSLLDKAESLEHVEYLEQKIKKSDKINRRTKLGRELTEQLLNACNQKALAIIKEKGATPF